MQTTISVGGMTCINCQNRIEKKLKKLAGVEDASVDYAAGTAQLSYDEAAITLSAIKSAIESLGYTIEENQKNQKALQIAGTALTILALALLLRAFSTSSIAASFPLAETGMGYGMLLVIGLLTSVHCIAMCGGINLSQSLRTENRGLKIGQNERVNQDNKMVNVKNAVNHENRQVNQVKNNGRSLCSLSFSPLLYNTGRLLSYTAAGVTVGALGSVIAVSEHFRNMVLLLAGLLMALMGVNMLGLFPALRRFTPQLPQFLTRKTDGQSTGRGPLVIGILNGFMPCGPLQAMQLYALSTGNPVRGGVSMFLFCLGTIPLMFALGAAGGILSGAKGSAFSRRAAQAGAILVASMGVVMFANGLSGAGFGTFGRAPAQTADGAFEPVIRNGIQIVNSTLLPNRYPAITVQQGIPVRWTINAPQGSINGCNNRFIIREYGIQHTFSHGDNVIEFTPAKTGRFGYSCWMSMIRSTITVLAPGESAADFREPDISPKPAGVSIATNAVAVALLKEDESYQTVEIDLTDGGFEPAIVVIQRGLPVLWTININSSDPGSGAIIFPAYYTQIETEQGANPIQLIPTADFDFSTADNKFYGYVKVTAGLGNVDIEAIKSEVANHETFIYPDAYFERGGR